MSFIRSLSYLTFACAGLALAASPTAMAIDKDTGYIGFSGGVLFTDEDARFGADAESDAGFYKITFGSMVQENLAVELEFFRSDIDRVGATSSDNEFELLGAMVDLKWFPFASQSNFHPYFSIGAGIQETEQPEFNSTSGVAELGAGLFWQTSRHFGLHLEGLYRADLYDRPSDDYELANEFAVMLGVDILMTPYEWVGSKTGWSHNSSVGHGPYLGAMATFLHVDEEPILRQDAQDSLGLHVLVGYPLGDYVNLELKGFYTDLETASNRDYEIYGGGVDMLLFPFGRDIRIAPYGQLGAAYQKTTMENRDDTNNGVADAGIGMLLNLNDRVSLRTEARYRVDFFNTPGEGVTEHEELSLNVGLNVALTSKPGFASNRPVAMVTDDDNDGVLNINDRCPGTQTGTAVDEFGCPFVPTPKDNTRTQYTVYFLRAETTLDNVDKALLEKVAKTSIEYNASRILVTGHTDTEGDAGRNVKVAEARARAVTSFLRSLQVTAELKPVSLGEFSPATTDNTAEDKAKNRRAEIYLEK